MKVQRSVPFFLFLIALSLSATVSADGNLLANPGFEGAYTQYASFRTAIVAEGWTPWWQVQTKRDPDWQNRMPEFKAAAPYESRIHQGENAQQVFTAAKLGEHNLRQVEIGYRETRAPGQVFQ